MNSSSFYRRSARKHRPKWVVAQSAIESDLEVDDGEDDIPEMYDDDVLDPDFILAFETSEDSTPSASGSGNSPPVVVQPQSLPDDSDPEEEEDSSSLPRKKSRVSKKPQHEWIWKKEDITYPPLPAFYHPQPQCVSPPIEYFWEMFPFSLLEEIVFQTNVYARQRDVNSTFSIDCHELLIFIGIIIYMGNTSLSSIEDYWATDSRVPQVANFMSSKRFRLIKSLLHFNNNDNARSSTDRFFKVRPLFAAITRQFQKVAETPHQSIDEVMVAYKGTRAGSLRQYMRNKSDKWGYKLFCRGSVDGFIHDILLYQGESTFTNHHTKLTEEEQLLPVSTRVVVSLAKTLKRPKESAIYADNWFTSIDLVKYLRDKFGTRYVGTARINRIGNAPLLSVKEMEKKTQRGSYEFLSTDGILALRWRENKVVTLLSTDVGVEPMKTAKRYDKTQKKKVPIPCPGVIKDHNGRMGGIDKSDMLTHLYKTPMRARRWYMKLFGYTLDLCICNAWLLYKRDCKTLKEKVMPLKAFRMEISRFARSQKNLTQRMTCVSSDQLPAVVPLKKGQKAQLPHENIRYDMREPHMPVFVSNRQTCKYCSKKDDIHRSRWMCTVCQVALCLSDTRNCFQRFHCVPSSSFSTLPSPRSSPSTSSHFPTPSSWLMRTDSAVPTIHMPEPAKANATTSCTPSPHLRNDDVSGRPIPRRPRSAFKKRENLCLIADALSEEACNNEPSDDPPGDDLVPMEIPVKDPTLPVECKVAQVKSKDHPLKAHLNHGVVPSQFKWSRKLSTEMSIKEEEASEQVEMTVADFPFVHGDMEHFSKEELNGNDLVIKEHDVEDFLNEEMDGKNEVVKEEKDVDEFPMDEDEFHVKIKDGSFDYIVEEVEIDEILKEEPGGMPAEGFNGKESKEWYIEGYTIKQEVEEGL